LDGLGACSWPLIFWRLAFGWSSPLESGFVQVFGLRGIYHPEVYLRREILEAEIEYKTFLIGSDPSALTTPLMKRSARLIAKQSSHSASVTLYKAENATSDNEWSPPTKRVKLELDSVKTPSKKGKEIVKEEIKLEDVEELRFQVKGKRRTAPNSSPKKAKAIKQTLAIPHPAPDRWQEQYNTIKHMRHSIVAPVDTMGCDRAQLNETDPKVWSKCSHVA
jgi:hypothetical protein